MYNNQARLVQADPALASVYGIKRSNPSMIKQFGPLLHLQTLHFEAKHNYFKELVYRSKNMCKTLGERYQYYMSPYNTGGKFLSSGD